MAECLNYNCETVGDHEVALMTCNGARPAGISQVVLIACDSDIEDSADAEDGTVVSAAITADTAKLVEQIKMSLDNGETTLSPKTTGCGLPTPLYTTYSGTIEDYNFSKQTVNEFWGVITRGYSFKGAIARLCPKSGWDDQSLYLDGEIIFSGSPNISNDDANAAFYSISYQFKGSVTLIDTPAGVFE